MKYWTDGQWEYLELNLKIFYKVFFDFLGVRKSDLFVLVLSALVDKSRFLRSASSSLAILSFLFSKNLILFETIASSFSSFWIVSFSSSLLLNVFRRFVAWGVRGIEKSRETEKERLRTSENTAAESSCGISFRKYSSAALKDLNSSNRAPG